MDGSFANRTLVSRSRFLICKYEIWGRALVGSSFSLASQRCGAHLIPRFLVTWGFLFFARWLLSRVPAFSVSLVVELLYYDFVAAVLLEDNWFIRNSLQKWTKLLHPVLLSTHSIRLSHDNCVSPSRLRFSWKPSLSAYETDQVHPPVSNRPQKFHFCSTAGSRSEFFHFYCIC